MIERIVLPHFGIFQCPNPYDLNLECGWTNVLVMFSVWIYYNFQCNSVYWPLLFNTSLGEVWNFRELFTYEVHLIFVLETKILNLNWFTRYKFPVFEILHINLETMENEPEQSQNDFHRNPNMWRVSKPCILIIKFPSIISQTFSFWMHILASLMHCTEWMFS